jgi:hypothetical protein
MKTNLQLEWDALCRLFATTQDQTTLTATQERLRVVRQLMDRE